MTTVFDFWNGPVPAHKHPNGGGWVADTAFAAETAYVGPNARVYGDAQVYGKSKVSGNAQVFGNAQVSGYAQVYEEARVYGYAQVFGQVFGSAWVFGDTRVFRDAHVFGDAQVCGNAKVVRGQYSTTPITITRSDGYTFTYQSDNTIVAGCKDFTIAEAEAHWGNKNHHMHQESYAILKALISINRSRST